MIAVRRARREGHAEPETAIERHNGMAAVTAGPGREPGPGAVTGATFFPAGNRGAGRPEKWGPGAGRRDNHKPTVCSGTRTNRTVTAVLADGRAGDSTAFGPAVGALKRPGAPQSADGENPPIHGDGAHGPRKDLATARRAGCRLRAPIRITGPGRSGGTAGWHEESARRHAGIRGKAARDADAGRIPRRERHANREDWKGEVGQPARPGVEHVFSASRRTFGGHVAARKRENVARGVARKIAIYSAIPGAAGGA